MIRASEARRNPVTVVRLCLRLVRSISPPVTELPSDEYRVYRAVQWRNAKIYCLDGIKVDIVNPGAEDDAVPDRATDTQVGDTAVTGRASPTVGVSLAAPGNADVPVGLPCRVVSATLQTE